MKKPVAPFDASEDEQPVTYVTHDSTATITLNRPDTLNAMNNKLMRGISEALARVNDDKNVRLVVLTGKRKGILFGCGSFASRERTGTGSQRAGS